jgi:hypothetical protein
VATTIYVSCVLALRRGDAGLAKRASIAALGALTARAAVAKPALGAEADGSLWRRLSFGIRNLQQPSSLAGIINSIPWWLPRIAVVMRFPFKSGRPHVNARRANLLTEGRGFRPHHAFSFGRYPEHRGKSGECVAGPGFAARSRSNKQKSQTRRVGQNERRQLTTQTCSVFKGCAVIAREEHGTSIWFRSALSI